MSAVYLPVLFAADYLAFLRLDFFRKQTELLTYS